MELIDIVMIIIGFGIIIGSFLISEGRGKQNSIEESLVFDTPKTQKEVELLLEEAKGMLDTLSSDVTGKANDYLSKLSNEKIMAVDEFSQQILEKIRQNHEEVVFLYKMLSDKEEELKPFLLQLEQASKNVKNAGKQKEVEFVDEDAILDEAMRGFVNKEEAFDTDVVRPSASDTETNYNQEILRLHNKGLSVMEISKQLDIGQGEVQLVLNLVKGGKA